MSFKEWWGEYWLVVVVVLVIFGGIIFVGGMGVKRMNKCTAICNEAIPDKDSMSCDSITDEKSRYTCCWDAKIPFEDGYQRTEVCEDVFR